jgi:protease-4
MDFDNVNNTPASPPQSAFIPTAIPMQTPPHTPPRKKGLGWKIFWTIVLVLSILTNLLLLLALGGMAALISGTAFSGIEPEFEESVLIDGPAHQTLAVINLQDLIDEVASEQVRKQLQQAAEDDTVRGIIVRIISPGGYVSSSDQIYHEIKNFREQTGKPAVAFMQSVAASGGYYSAVACDKIIAEPTVITGSIGVIMSHLVVQDLLEQKLGIQPVVVKSGEKKDWPSLFTRTTEEQTAYLKEKLIQPAFERFLEVVCEGRQDVLTCDEVRRLADGSIYPAPEALRKGLIDEIGYLKDAVALAEQLAGIQGSRVVEYKQRFAFWDLLAAQEKTPLQLDRKTIHQWATPELMYLWDGRQ